MGSVVFTDTHSCRGVGEKTYDVRISYSETYIASTRSTKVKITDVEIRMRDNTINWPESPVKGTIKINGTTMMTLSGGSAHACHLDGSGYCSVSIPSSAEVSVQHDATTGQATMSLQIIGGYNEYFAMYYRQYSPGTDDIILYAGAETETKSVSLTTRAATLTVNPNGGSWSGSSSSQTFTQIWGSTKTIANPTRSGYTFNRWTLSGGGTLSGTTYTFGETNGTLTASWTRISYSITYNANGGSGAPASGSVYAGNSYTISSTVPTRTGYTFLGWSTNSQATTATYSSGQSITPTGNMVLYAIWSLNSYTLTISGDAHSIITVKRGSTTLTNGATIYYGDTLTISISASTGYKVSTRSPAANSVTVTGNLTVSATTEPMATIHIRKIGNWALYLIYIRRSGQWQLHQANIRKNSAWAKYF